MIMTLIHPFIKLDAQGYEMNILLGAMNTIKQHCPVLLIETPDEDITALLSPLGYTHYAYQKNRLVRGYGRVNTLYFTRDQIENAGELLI